MVGGWSERPEFYFRWNGSDFEMITKTRAAGLPPWEPSIAADKLQPHEPAVASKTNGFYVLRKPKEGEQANAGNGPDERQIGDYGVCTLKDWRPSSGTITDCTITAGKSTMQREVIAEVPGLIRVEWNEPANQGVTDMQYFATDILVGEGTNPNARLRAALDVFGVRVPPGARLDSIQVCALYTMPKAAPEADTPVITEAKP